MKNTLVIYGSRYGSTKQYAEEIAVRLGADIQPFNKVNSFLLCNYSTVIFGGGIYAGGIYGIKVLKSDFDIFKDKHLAVFTCGIADPKLPKNREVISKYVHKYFTDDQFSKITLFSLRGCMDYSKMSFTHKAMMKMLVSSLKRRPESSLTKEDKQLIESYGKLTNFVDLSSVAPIVRWAILKRSSAS